MVALLVCRRGKPPQKAVDLSPIIAGNTDLNPKKNKNKNKKRLSASAREERKKNIRGRREFRS